MKRNVKHFNSQPHKEADFCCAIFYLLGIYFNSQPHKEADYTPNQIDEYNRIFQFTASQGG